MKDLIIATHNKGKFKEFKKMFGKLYNVCALPYNGWDGEAEESGTNYYENALLKAKYVYDNTGVLCLADDSGLCVNALNGEPGLYSARYGGEETPQTVKNQMIIDRLSDKSDRSAKFVCCLVLYDKNGVVAVGNGEVKGSILYKEEGEGGFGYDPIFFCDDLNKSFGVATNEEKNLVSHRGRAIEDLLQKLKG